MHTYIYASFVVGCFLSVSSLVFYCFCASLFWAKHSGWKSKTDTCPKTIHGGGKSNGLKQIDFCLIFSFVWQKRSNKTGFICSWIFFFSFADCGRDNFSLEKNSFRKNLSTSLCWYWLRSKNYLWFYDLELCTPFVY